MRYLALHRKGWLAGPAGALTVGALTAGAMLAASLIGTGASASVTHASRPAPPRARQLARGQAAASTATTRYPVRAFTQEFQYNTKYFCPAGSGNLPCDGAVNDYGTIDRVPSGFSNGGAGNYAPSTKALAGGWMALVSGSQVINQGKGCPSAATEYCTGPYALFGTGSAEGAENVFPRNGFTVTDDLYLSPTTVAPAGALVDDDVELNNSSGTYGRDNVITACPEAGGFVINFGEGSPGSCAGTPVVTTDGWYRFVFIFSNVGGDAYLTEKVLQEPTATLVASNGPLPVGGTPTPLSDWGGPGYFWLPTEDISGLPLANFALQLGQVPGGHKP